MIQKILGTLAFMAIGFTAQAQSNPTESVFLHISACSAVIDSVPITLDVMLEYNNKTDQPTGNGYIVQTMGNLPNKSFKSLARITVNSQEGSTIKRVNMYAILEPSILFSSFDIDMEKATTVEVYANHFGAVWGTFACKPPIE